MDPVLVLDAAAQSLLRWGGLRIKRERHAEFHSYTFYLDGDHDSPSAILSRTFSTMEAINCQSDMLRPWAESSRRRRGDAG